MVRRRRMVRSFEPRPVPPEIVERILGHALRAPSAGFTQGWAFLVLEGRDETERYWEAAFPQPDRSRFGHPGLFDAPLLVVALAHPRAYVDRYAEPDKGRWQPDPDDWPVPWWHVDTGFAVLLMLLTTVDCGLGALFFAVSRPEAVRDAFGVPAEYVPLGTVAVGYPRQDRPSPSLRRGRRPMEEVMHRGRW